MFNKSLDETLSKSCVLFFARSELSWGSGRERSTSGNIGGNKFRKLKLEDTRVVVGRGPLVEVGGSKTRGHRGSCREKSTSGNRGQ